MSKNLCVLPNSGNYDRPIRYKFRLIGQDKFIHWRQQSSHFRISLFPKNNDQTDATYYFIVLLIGSKMFRTLLCPSSGARDYNVDYHISRYVLGLLYFGG